MRINSLMTRFNSLLGANKFPVPMRRNWVVRNKGGFTYTVFSAVGKWGKSCFTPQEEARTCLRGIQGVAVQKDGKEVANFPCSQGPDYELGQFGPEFWDKIGLEEGSPQQEFDIPQAFFRN